MERRPASRGPPEATSRPVRARLAASTRSGPALRSCHTGAVAWRGHPPVASFQHAVECIRIIVVSRDVVSDAGHPWYPVASSWHPPWPPAELPPAEQQRVALLRSLPAPVRSRIAIAWESVPDDPLPLRKAIGDGARRCRDAEVPPERMLALLTLLMPEIEREDTSALDRPRLRQEHLSLALEQYRSCD